MASVLTKAHAVEGFALARPSIEALLASERVKSEMARRGRDQVAIHVVALNPEDGSILNEESFGDVGLVAERHYDEYARAKAAKAYRQGMSGDRAKYIAPWSSRIGDIRFAGAAFEDGFCTASSGLKSNLDTMVSWLVFNLTAGVCLDDLLMIDEDPDASAYYQ